MFSLSLLVISNPVGLTCTMMGSAVAGFCCPSHVYMEKRLKRRKSGDIESLNFIGSEFHVSCSNTSIWNV